MIILEAYCVELKRNISIMDARNEYLNSKFPIKFRFQCVTENCVQPNGERTEIIGCNYTKRDNEQTAVRPYFRTHPQQEHNEHCKYYQDKQSIEIYSSNKTNGIIYNRKQPYHFDECGLFDDDDDENENKIKREKKIQSNFLEINMQSNRKRYSDNGEIKYRKRIARSVVDFVEMYWGYQKQLQQKLITQNNWKEITFINGNKIEYLYLFFRRCEKVWNNKLFNGIYIGYVNEVISTKNGICLLFSNTVNIDNEDIMFYLFIPNKLIENNDNISNSIKKIEESKNIDNMKIRAYFCSPDFAQKDNKIFFVVKKSKHIHIHFQET